MYFQYFKICQLLYLLQLFPTTFWIINIVVVYLFICKYYETQISLCCAPTCQFLPSWSPTLQVQGSGFSLRGALWATSPSPAEAVVDMASQTQSEDRSHSWNIKGKGTTSEQFQMIYYVHTMTYFSSYRTSFNFWLQFQ